MLNIVRVKSLYKFLLFNYIKGTSSPRWNGDDDGDGDGDGHDGDGDSHFTCRETEGQGC